MKRIAIGLLFCSHLLAACDGVHRIVRAAPGDDASTDGDMPPPAAPSPDLKESAATYDGVGMAFAANEDYVDNGLSRKGSISIAQMVALGPGSVTRKQVGSCFLTTWGSNAAPQFVSAGTIAFGGGLRSDAWTFSGGNYQESQPIPSGVFNWPPSAVVTVNATGATLPAFSVMSVMPSKATIVAPAPDTKTISRSLDLTVKWSGGSQNVSFTLHAVDGELRCDFPAAAGQGVIPASTLSLLKAGPGSVAADVTDTSDLDVGGLYVRAGALAASVATTGNVYRFDTELQ
jgi:hypothetical protein